MELVFFGTATVKRIYLKHQMFVIFCLTLMRIFWNSPNKLHINSSSEKIASPKFHAVFFICKLIPEISKIKKRTQRDHYFTFNALLKHFNKRFLHEVWDVFTYRKVCTAIRDFKKDLFMNYIMTLAFTRKL